MPGPVCRVMALLCAPVAPLPVATSLGLRRPLWMLLSGRRLRSRGAVLPAPGGCGRAAAAVRRAWAALGPGGWACAALLAPWAAALGAGGRWQPHAHPG